MDNSYFVVTSRDSFAKASSRRSTALLFLDNEEDPLNSWLPCTQKRELLFPKGAGKAVHSLKGI